MKNEITFEIEASRLEAENLVKKYYNKNGYYEVKTDQGLKFKKTSFSKLSLSPKRLYQEISINFSNKESTVEIQKIIKSHTGTGGLTIIDKEYLENFLEHFKKSILSGEVEKFQINTNNEEVKKISRKYNLIIIILILLGILFGGGLMVILRLEPLPMIIICTIIVSVQPIIGTAMINRLILKSRQEN